MVGVGLGGEPVVCDDVAGDGFAVVWAEELGGSMPELAGFVGGDSVEGVFEGSVAF